MALREPYSKIAPQGNAFHMVVDTGDTIGLGALDPIFSLQWTSSAYRCCIQMVRWQVVFPIAYAAAQLHGYALYFARAFTVADTGGGAIGLTLNQAKVDTMGGTSAIADMRVSATATLTAGTRTLDTLPICRSLVWMSNALVIGVADRKEESRFGYTTSTNHITLRQNEGLVLSNVVAMGATGTARVSIELEWVEVPTNFT